MAATQPRIVETFSDNLNTTGVKGLSLLGPIQIPILLSESDGWLLKAEC